MKDKIMYEAIYSENQEQWVVNIVDSIFYIALCCDDFHSEMFANMIADALNNSMRWLDIHLQSPEDGQKVLGYFDVFDSIEIYRYIDLSKTEFAEYGVHQFGNKSGFLTDDIIYWMPLPEIPIGDK